MPWARACGRVKRHSQKPTLSPETSPTQPRGLSKTTGHACAGITGKVANKDPIGPIRGGTLTGYISEISNQGHSKRVHRHERSRSLLLPLSSSGALGRRMSASFLFVYLPVLSDLGLILLVTWVQASPD